ncbi:hypothetical protein C4K04_0788 [Pseudomonas chlororaphis]|uniref:Uncharacterized protein n=1 Tax=Pseudomonas chlororaphis TaxID=587753 RepID=A0A3G7TH95_9PSED|nr:hypothetical protein C4K04_0788 [Pseudomonas chlororaphis]
MLAMASCLTHRVVLIASKLAPTESHSSPWPLAAGFCSLRYSG